MLRGAYYQKYCGQLLMHVIHPLINPPYTHIHFLFVSAERPSDKAVTFDEGYFQRG